jgi:uncharacterized YigZ family protein
MLLTYKTIPSYAEGTYKEKGSLFVARAYPVKSVDEAMLLLEKNKKELYDAAHHCYALRLHDGTTKYSDAGEPSGTAGVRILQAIEHHDVHDVAVVVIRYFGGIKLGVGPLGKAYYTASDMALEKCVKISKYAFLEMAIRADYDRSSALYHLFSQYPVKILNTAFDEDAEFSLLVRLDVVEEFQEKLIDVCSGRVKILNIQKETMYL